MTSKKDKFDPTYYFIASITCFLIAASIIAWTVIITKRHERLCLENTTCDPGYQPTYDQRLHGCVCFKPIPVQGDVAQ
jgi:hypothetical protein